MYIVVTFLSILSRLPLQVAAIGMCEPNTNYTFNGQLCACDSMGRWLEANCSEVRIQHTCTPGRITWQGCTRCMCEKDGQFTCNRSGCIGVMTTPSAPKTLQKKLIYLDPWCIPFRSYYVECNICACPASGRTDLASCALDISCTLNDTLPAEVIVSEKQNCIPKVTYIFSCLQCLCTDDGIFARKKCTERCPISQPTSIAEITHRCIPKTFFKKDCNVCYCPDNGVPDESTCTKSNCTNTTVYQPLKGIINKRDCVPLSLTKVRCIYCECNSKGIVFENACLEQECLNRTDADYSVTRETCGPGELVPLCIECFCPDLGVTNQTFCSQSCSHQNQMSLLELVQNESQRDPSFINRGNLKKLTIEEHCDARFIYIAQASFCLCPDNGNTNLKLCADIFKETSSKRLKDSGRTLANHLSTLIDVNEKCEPNTYVEFDCNSCVCSKEGLIDPKWCTYDDCTAKKHVEQAHTSARFPFTVAGRQESVTCDPGTISKLDCNFCICSETGLIKDRACTKNKCPNSVNQPTNVGLMSCEPLAYFEVDCNVCFCPRDGLKNIAKCSKNVCEKSFLRTGFEVCAPGQLFSDECNVCICPPNGQKHDKACTNFTCPDASAAWKEIFKVPLALLDNELDDPTKFLDVCFPGEEFNVGCKVCVCPEVGLRTYATCTHMLCDDNEEELLDDTRNNNRHYADLRTLENVSHLRTRRDNRSLESQSKNTSIVAEIVGSGRREEGCKMHNFTHGDREQCTVGSMYIISCQECICPLRGSIMNFCRPLPPEIYCEQPYPGINYLPMGRSQNESVNSTTSQTEKDFNQTISNGTASALNQTLRPSSLNLNQSVNSNITRKKHTHTKYHCGVPGRVTDDCFICECELELAVIVEHCFRSDAEDCVGKRPSFLNDTNKFVFV